MQRSWSKKACPGSQRRMRSTRSLRPYLWVQRVCSCCFFHRIFSTTYSHPHGNLAWQADLDRDQGGDGEPLSYSRSIRRLLNNLKSGEIKDRAYFQMFVTMCSSSYTCHSPLPEDEGVQRGSLVVVRRLPRRIYRDVLGHLLHGPLTTTVVGVYCRCVYFLAFADDFASQKKALRPC